MHIAICDDDHAAIRLISSIVNAWAAAREITIQINTFPSAEAFLFRYADRKDYDILLLDIEMGNVNGVSLAKEVRKNDREVQIIFITGFSDYIADGYDVEALQYLMKPLDQAKLFTTLDRAVEKLKKNTAALFFDLPDGMVRIPLYEIRYIEVRANYVTIHGNTDISVKNTLSAMESKLDNNFFRIGRSFLVNLKFIRRVTKTEVILSDGTTIPLARGYYEPLNRAIITNL